MAPPTSCRGLRSPTAIVSPGGLSLKVHAGPVRTTAIGLGPPDPDRICIQIRRRSLRMGPGALVVKSDTKLFQNPRLRRICSPRGHKRSDLPAASEFPVSNVKLVSKAE